MARTEDTALSALLSALGKGVMQLPVEMEKQKEVQRQNALTQYQMMQQQQQQRVASEENALRMNLMRLQQQELNEKIRRAAMEPYMTPEQKAEFTRQNTIKDIEALKPLGMTPAGVKPLDLPNGDFGGISGFDKLSAPTRDVAILFGSDAAKKYVGESRINPSLSQESYTNYLAKVRERNAKTNEKNAEIEHKNQLYNNNPKLVRQVSPLEEELSYEDWRVKQEQLLGITPDAAYEELRKRGKAK